MALLRALNPELNAAQLKAILVETAAPGVTNEATPGQPSPLDQSVPIPEGRGAGVLRVDQAALRVVNDLRQSKGEPSPTLDQFLDIGRVGLRATGQGSGYQLTASVPAALGGSADVKLEILGEHVLSGGSTTQNIPAGGEASWGLSLQGDSIFIRATRLDNGTCATLNLSAAPQVEAGFYVLRNVSSEPWVIDSSSDPTYFDGLDAIYASDFIVPVGAISGGGFYFETRREEGLLIELSPTTYSIPVTFAIGAVPADEDEQYVYLDPVFGDVAQMITFTIIGTCGVDAKLEWDGVEIKQVG